MKKIPEETNTGMYQKDCATNPTNKTDVNSTNLIGI
jgi:hypothetical protein